MKLRLRVSKEGAVRFISHLEYSRLLGRAVRRAKIPVAYSEGFNPHIRMSLASALGVGIESVAEYVEFELAGPIEAACAMAALNSSLPNGVRVLYADIAEKSQPLMAQVTGAEYQASILCPPEAAKNIMAAINTYNTALQAPFTKKTPPGKQRREIDFKKYIKEFLVKNTADGIRITFFVRITPQGTVKAQEALILLAENFSAPLAASKVSIKRTKLYGAGSRPLLMECVK